MPACHARHMSVRLKRKAFFIDERELREPRRALGASTDAETVRTALREVTSESAGAVHGPVAREPSPRELLAPLIAAEDACRSHRYKRIDHWEGGLHGVGAVEVECGER